MKLHGITISGKPSQRPRRGNPWAHPAGRRTGLEYRGDRITGIAIIMPDRRPGRRTFDNDYGQASSDKSQCLGQDGPEPSGSESSVPLSLPVSGLIHVIWAASA